MSGMMLLISLFQGVPPSINLPDYDSLSFNADHHITEPDGNPSIESEFDADLDSPTDFEAIPANITGSSSRSTESLVSAR